MGGLFFVLSHLPTFHQLACMTIDLTDTLWTGDEQKWKKEIILRKDDEPGRMYICIETKDDAEALYMSLDTLNARHFADALLRLAEHIDAKS